MIRYGMPLHRCSLAVGATPAPLCTIVRPSETVNRYRMKSSALCHMSIPTEMGAAQDDMTTLSL